jgi:Homeodomain-like domain
MEELRMTKKELNKIDVLALISKGKMKMKKGAEELGITKRRLRRLRRRYEEEGGEVEIALKLSLRKK